MNKRDELDRFYKENGEIIKNKLLGNFLKEEENEYLLGKVLINPTSENKERLEQKFKEYHLKVRVIAYISKLIRYYTVDYDKRRNKREQRYLLILDKPIENDEGDLTVGVLDIIGTTVTTEQDYYESEVTLDELLEDEGLYRVYSGLTDKQKEVLDLIYIHGYTNKEVAEYFNETPQNISRIHRKALNYIRTHYKKG